MTGNLLRPILVSGGAGFIGSNLVAELLRKKHRVILVDNFDETYNPKFKIAHIAPFIGNKNFVLYTNDIRDLAGLKAIFEKEKPAFVVHLAAKADTRDAVINPYDYISVNVGGTLNVLELARDFSIKKTVIASSASVYGNNPNIPWKEEENSDLPLSAYAASKKAAEMLAYTYHYNFDMNIVCLRYFNVYGENNRPGMVAYKWAEAFLTNSEVELSGKGTRKRDFTYVRDAVEAIILALKSPLKYEIINIAGSQPISLTELFSVFEKVTGFKPPVRSRPSHHASANEMAGDISKARKLLGWKPKVPIEEGVSKLLSWFRQNRLTKSF